MVLYELGLEQYPLLSILCRMWHTAGTECDWMNASPRPTDPVLTSDRPVGSPFATGDNCPSLGSSPHLPSKLRPHWSSTSHTGAPDLDPLSSLSTYAL